MDLYRLLEVDPAASSTEITRAYRRLARRWHPDVTTCPGAAEHFANITAAYRVLSDPGARARYDRTRATSTTTTSRSGATRHRGGLSGNDPWPLWAGQNMRTTDAGAPAAFWLGGPNFSHAFTTDSIPTTRDPEADAEVEISVEEAYLGTCRTLTVTGTHGSTAVPVTIPPGVVTDDLVRVPVEHLSGGRGGPPVVLRVRLAPHERYRIEGRDVHLDLPLAPWEAALGGPVTLQTPAGQARLTVPAGTCTGGVLTVPGYGLPSHGGPAGNLCAHAGIVVPSQLSATERRLFSQLAATSTFHPRSRSESRLCL